MTVRGTNHSLFPVRPNANSRDHCKSTKEEKTEMKPINKQLNISWTTLHG